MLVARQVSKRDSILDTALTYGLLAARYHGNAVPRHEKALKDVNIEHDMLRKQLAVTLTLTRFWQHTAFIEQTAPGASAEQVMPMGVSPGVMNILSSARSGAIAGLDA